MMEVAALTEVVKNFKGPSPYGVSCKFIKLSDEWGIKVYESKFERDKAVQRQTHMASVGLAPKVAANFDIQDAQEYNNKYCYVTEIAIPISDGNMVAKSWYQICQDVVKEYPDIDKAININVVRMRKYGFFMQDTHYANWGLLNGELVCIDFAE